MQPSEHRNPSKQEIACYNPNALERISVMDGLIAS